VYVVGRKIGLERVKCGALKELVLLGCDAMNVQQQCCDNFKILQVIYYAG
jgi:hypothetical protein